VFGAFLLVRSTILTPVSTALMFPFIAMSLTAAAAYAPGIARHARAISAVVLLALGALVASGKHLEQFGLTSHNGLGIQVDVFPVDAAAVVSRPAFPQHILSLASDGAFLATRLPAREIYCDTRGSLFGAGFYDRLARALVGDPKAMHEIEADCAPGAILLDCTWPMSGSAASALLAQGRWALAYFDGTTAILMRNTSENLQFLRDRRLQRSGLDKLEKARRAYVEKMDAPIGNANCARLVGAGNLYLALNQFREAEIVYRLLTQGTPRMHSAWLGLGIAQVQLGRHTDAIASLQHAVELRKKDPLALLWLSFAYHYAGKKADAEDAVARARALNADFTTAFLKNPPVRPPKS
jgi:tetratricopeptide (TPR) repeat protein